MDPDQALQDLVRALEDLDLDLATEAARNLCRWLDQGGFLPKLDRATLSFLLGELADRIDPARRRAIR